MWRLAGATGPVMLMLLSVTGPAAAEQSAGFETRLAGLIAALDGVGRGAVSRAAGPVRLLVEDCDAYPYARSELPTGGRERLLDDAADGLRTGLACLAGSGPAGPLHAYHRAQAERLLTLLTDDSVKTLRCVKDQMFANAVATTPTPPEPGDGLYAQLSQVAHPGIVIDLYRVGGLLSRAFERRTYREFYRMDDDQIDQHLTAHPVRLDGLHRHDRLPALMFHEMVHWLGFTHARDVPDLAQLYETCCFDGSTYVDSATLNAQFGQRACRILQDPALWDRPGDGAAQRRVWRDKGYAQLKLDMRASYD